MPLRLFIHDHDFYKLTIPLDYPPCSGFRFRNYGNLLLGLSVFLLMVLSYQITVTLSSVISNYFIFYFDLSDYIFIIVRNFCIVLFYIHFPFIYCLKTIFPFAITERIVLIASRFSQGFSFNRRRSAKAPSCTTPIFPSCQRILAALLVAVLRTS